MANHSQATMETQTAPGAGAGAENDDVKVLSDAVSALPPHAVKDLLAIGVCVRCIFRLFGLRECIRCCASLSPSSLGAVFGKVMVDISYSEKEGLGGAHSSQESEIEPNLCRICLGILQFAYYDNKKMLTRRGCGTNFAAFVGEMVRQEGYQIDNFALEVSVPPVIMDNEEATWLYLKRKYESELWFREKCLSERISAKDALKFSITNALENLLGVQCGLSSFHIRLTYTNSEASTKAQESVENKESNKRRKTDGIISAVSVTGREINGSQNRKLLDCQLEKVKQPCSFALLCCKSPIYIGGRYLKYSRNVSQSRWIIDDERMGEASVEEIIGSNFLPMCKGDNYKFHAAGREDIDVRMLGSGRPFLVEIHNARHVPDEAFMKEIETKINSTENKLVKVKNLKLVDNQGWSLMREGEAEKQKQYTALVWIARSLKDDDLRTISTPKDMQILQRTPIRVLHRRSPLERERTIHWMKVEKIAGSSQYFLLHLRTQAGTYIKEFVHGDLGRTTPSIGTILGCRAEILQLDVTDVKMDCFLDE